MASKSTKQSLAAFVLLNLVFFSLVSARNSHHPPKPRPPPPSHHPPKPRPPSPPHYPPKPWPSTPRSPPPTPSPPIPPTPTPPMPPTHPPPPTCPRNALQLDACVDLLDRLVNVTIGMPPVTPCCSLIEGLVDLEAAVCLCTAIKLSLLGISLNLRLTVILLLNVCSRDIPRDFVCPP